MNLKFAKKRNRAGQNSTKDKEILSSSNQIESSFCQLMNIFYSMRYLHNTNRSLISKKLEFLDKIFTKIYSFFKNLNLKF